MFTYNKDITKAEAKAVLDNQTFTCAASRHAPLKPYRTELDDKGAVTVAAEFLFVLGSIAVAAAVMINLDSIANFILG